MRAHLETLKQLTAAEGRDFSALTISYKAPLYDAGIPSPDGSRRPFSGNPEEIAADIRIFAAIGVRELVFDCRGQSITESIERLQWFATDVIRFADCFWGRCCPSQRHRFGRVYRVTVCRQREAASRSSCRGPRP
jgi:hypothetical protein